MYPSQLVSVVEGDACLTTATEDGLAVVYAEAKMTTSADIDLALKRLPIIVVLVCLVLPALSRV